MKINIYDNLLKYYFKYIISILWMYYIYIFSLTKFNQVLPSYQILI
jgi:hypothetical protein